MKKTRTRIGSIALSMAMLLSLLPISALAVETGNTLEVGAGKTYTTIQSAVDAANDGDIISIANGTYIETVTITDKALTLKGESETGVVIGFDYENRNATATYAGTACYPIVSSNSDLTLETLTVAGPTAQHHGIGGVLANADLTMDHVTVKDIRCTADGGYVCGVQYGRGIMVDGNGDVSITNCTVEDFQKNAIDLNTTGTVVVDNNVIKGVGTQTIIGQNGVVIRQGSATVTNNKISSLSYTADNEWAYGSVGIYPLEDVTALTITGNTLDAVDVALYTEEVKPEVLATATIVDNTVINPTLPFTIEGEGYPTFQAAIAAAQDGDTINLAAGTYDIGTLTLTKTVSLKGAGAGETVLNGKIQYAATSTAENGESITVEGIKLVATDTANDKGIRWSYVQDPNNSGKISDYTLNIKDCVIEGFEYGTTVDTGATNCMLNVSGTTFDTGCAVSVKDGNKVTAYENSQQTGFAVQYFNNGYSVNGYYNDYSDFAEDQESGNYTPDISANENTVVFSSKELQSALSSAESGDTIYLAAGEYEIGALNLATNVNLVGAGAGKTVLYGSIGQGQSIGDTTFSGFTMVSTGSHVALNIAGAFNSTSGTLTNATITVKDCTFENYEYTIGLNSYTENCKLVIEGCTFTGCACAAAVQTGNGNTVTFDDATDVGDGFAIQSFGSNYNDFYYEKDADLTSEPDLDATKTPVIFVTSATENTADKMTSVQNGGVIILTGNVTLDKAVELTSDKTVTVQGNGHTLTFPVTASGGSAFFIPSAAENVTLNVNNVVFKTADDSNLNGDGTPKTGFGILVGESTNNVNVSADYCSFSDLWCGVYFGHVPAGKTGSVSITNSTYENVKYGYSIDEVTAGSQVGAVKPTFTGNTEGVTESEPWANIILDHEGTQVAYTTLAAALAAAQDNDVITLNKDVTEKITIDKAVTIEGNNHTITGADANVAVTVTVPGVTLNNLNVTGVGSRGLALVVGALDNPIEGGVTINGGIYTTSLDTPGLQGEGAIRVFAAGNVTVKDATTVGGIHLFNPGSYEITGNTIGFTYTGEAALVGILLKTDGEASASALMADNTIGVPNANSFYVKIEPVNSWDSTDEVPASGAVASIGANRYATLQDAVDAVADNGTITLIADCNETVMVSRVVTFAIDKNNNEFTGFVYAGSGYQVSEANGTYTVTEYIPSPGGSSSYAITVEKADNGTVTASRTSASKNLTITLTVKADEGYKLDTITVTDKNGNEIKLTDKGDGKYTFTMPSSAVTVKASFVEDDGSVDTGLPFTDVKADDWFFEAVKYVYDNKLMDGTSTTTFAPLMTTNRAMIVTILWRLEGQPETDATLAFTDVESGVWYTDAVNWAASKGIVKGYSDTVFAPNDTVTREQLATILYRYAETKGYDVSAEGDLTTFADGANTSSWAAEAMEWAVGSGLLSGKDGGKLDPTGTATRAEVATILMRFVEYTSK